ncbi:ParA family protein [Methylobacterium sp. SD21]|uniref:ParA family protein n=1 Tax=Methylobacterium litchii TaxID=3138810 RepID=UPI00313D02D2
MQILTLASQKGGSGKTTLAASLAVAAYESGERVVVVDLDPQRSLTSWGMLRSAGGIVFRTIAPADLDHWVTSTRRTPVVTLCIVDTPGTFGPEVDVALRHANCALVPVRASVLDLWASAPTARRIAAMGRILGFVVNAASPVSYARTNDVIATLGENGLVGPVISERVAHRDAMATGLGVTELDPAGKAAAEIRELWAWTKQRMPTEQVSV